MNLILGILIILNQQCKETLCQGYNRDEYPPKHEYVDRKYKHLFADLTAVPDDIPADALQVNIGRNRITPARGQRLLPSVTMHASFDALQSNIRGGTGSF